MALSGMEENGIEYCWSISYLDTCSFAFSFRALEVLTMYSLLQEHKFVDNVRLSRSREGVFRRDDRNTCRDEINAWLNNRALFTVEFKALLINGEKNVRISFQDRKYM